MTQTHTSTGGCPGAERYEIRLGGHLENRWGAWFDGLSITHESDGTTVISGPVVDQAALHGLLQKVRDLGLPLVSLVHVPPDPAQQHPTDFPLSQGDPA
jgi:hypothetical protein